MAVHEAMLTVLPNGTTEGGRLLRATIFVTPRLRGASRLDGFRGFEVWPDTLDRIRLRLAFDGGPTFDADVDPRSPRRSRDDWLRLFPADTPVRDCQLKDLADRRWRSYPFDEVLQRVRRVYADVAAQSPTSFPDLGSLAERFGRLGHIGRYPQELYATFESAFRTTEPRGGSVVDRNEIGKDDLTRERAAFGQLARFYDRPGTRIGKDDPVPPEPVPPKLDFHDGCAALGDYWELLRRVGLAIDVVVPNDVPAPGRVRVEVEAPDDDWLHAEPMRPWTRYVMPDRSLFFAEWRDDGDLSFGMLQLGRERHVVTDLDVDGSGLKVFDFAKTVTELQQQASSMDPDGQSMPALRNGGLTVARRDRAAGVADRVAAVSMREDDTVNNGNPAELWADDLTRGYRVDVRDDVTGRWWSLCRRDGVYEVTRDGNVEPLTVAPDEGYVKSASATSTPAGLPGSDADLYLHEALFGWDGWSLVAPRPGAVFPTHAAEVTEPDRSNPLGLSTAFTPQRGSLPALRYGRTYEVRARAVDLAANSWAPDDDGVPGDTAAPPHTYLRWEPVPSPALVPRRPFGEGESLLRLVIRSTRGESTDTYVALPRVQSLAGHETVSGADGLDRSYRTRDERHVLPPKSALQLAEHHGALDPALGPGRPQSARDDMLAIAVREEGTLFDVAGARVVNVAQTPTPLPLPRRGQPLAEGETIVVDTNAIALPYLPDVLARGAAFTGLPGATGIEQHSFGSSWPDRSPFRVVLVSGDAAPVFTDAADEGRVLTVSLPQGHMARVRLSCHLERQDPARSDLDLLAVWDLVPSSLKPKLEALALAGQHWMLTPGVELVLVHAVEMPLDPPVLGITTGTIHRLAAETFASLGPTVDLDAKSTGRLDIDAQWNEPIDDVMRPAPTVQKGAGHVADFGVGYDEEPVRIGRDDVAGDHPVHRARHEMGDTKHRLVTYTATATTRYREYFPPEVTSRPDLITHVGPPRTVHVPSSARPDPPEVLYVVPTFRWEQEALRPSRVSRRGGGFRRTRHGGGLRVYLDRPWFSSGADEMLGVVVPDQKPPIRWADVLGPKFDEALLTDAARRLNVRGMTAERLGGALVDAVEAAADRGGSSVRGAELDLAGVVLDASTVGVLLGGDASGHVTRWGHDPIWSPTALPAAGPRIQSFTNHDRWDTGLSIFEVPFARVAVAAFEPQYDADRRLWYCDIDIDTGPSYFPFVRLALARYQPYSIEGAHLSKIVMADFAQVVPDRSTTVRAERGSLAVTVRGVAAANDIADRLYRPASDDAGSIDDCRLVVATVERTDRGTDVGWRSTGHRVVLSLGGFDGSEAWWAGRVRLPDPDDRFDHRLAVEEHELYETDPSQAEYWETTLETDTVDLGPFELDVTLPRSTALRTRLIYADHFALRVGDGQLVVDERESSAPRPS